MNILAVIPARGGSKGIPRKNIRIMNGKPLITFSIENAKSCGLLMDIAVTTDDEEIIGIAKLNGVDYIVRDAELSGDDVTLDPVIYDAVNKMESKKHVKYDIVITMQPTSPLLKGKTLRSALEKFLADDKDSYISVVNKAHLTWSKSEDGYIPNYEARVNRQKLPPLYFETGAFFISRREFVKPDSRLGTNISVFEVPEDEAVDIDSTRDWIICEHALKKKRILFRTDGHKKLGMGHIYHCLTLAYNLMGHEVMFATKRQHADGVNKIKASFMPYTQIESDEDFFELLQGWKPDIVVHDCLDTEAEYIKKIRNFTKRVVTIEDLGEGTRYADAVINALYNDKKPVANRYSGEKYVCLREEFLINMPKDFSVEVKNVLVLFGGTDPSNLTKRIYDLAKRMDEFYPDITFNFITGGGYDCEKNDIRTIEKKKIYILNDVKMVSEYMRDADLAFTSQGRTVFELASLGVPSIVMAQNEREQLHTFAQMQNGFLNLGVGKDISPETIESTFKWLVETEQIRREMRDLMLKHDLKKGVKRVIDIILNEE